MSFRRSVLFLVVLAALAATGAHPACAASLTPPDKLVFPPLAFTPPAVPRYDLPNGLALFALADHDVSLVDVHVVVRAGMAHDPAGREGLAELTAQVLRTGGAAVLSAPAVDEALERIAAILDVQVGLEDTTLHLSLQKKDLDTGLVILAGLLQQPAFAEDRLRLARSLQQEELRRLADDPQGLAFHTFRTLLYRGDPRGRAASLATLEAIQPADLLAFHREHYRPENTMIAVTGDIAPAQAAAHIRTRFQSWARIGPPAGSQPPPRPERSGVFFLAKETPQAVILWGQDAPARGHADACAFETLDFLLGSGGFRSRIFQEIRTDQGLAYATGSLYRGRASYGIFQAYVLTGAVSAPRTASLLARILQQVRETPVRAEELLWAQRAMENSFLFSFQSAGDAALQNLRLAWDGLPKDHLHTYRQRIGGVTREEVHRVAQRYLQEAQATVFVLGPESLFEPLRALWPGIRRVSAPQP